MTATPDPRVAVVSGAGTGIGRAIARRLTGLGWKVAIGGRRTELLEETVGLVGEAGGTAMAHTLDVGSADSIDAFFGAVEAAYGTVDVVVNNAAVGHWGRLEDMTPEEIQADIATKLVGSLLMARRAIPGMRALERGDLLFVSSTSTVDPFPQQVPYSAANAGIEQGARSLNLELEGTGIRCGVLRIGNTGGTDFSTEPRSKPNAMEVNQLWFRQALIRHVGLMTPEMVADAVAGAVTLPHGHRYGLMEVTPTAPVGPLPQTYEEFVTAMMRSLGFDV